MEAQPPFERTPASSPPSGPGLPQCPFLHLSLTCLSQPPRPGHPELIPQGTRVTRSRPTPTRARSGPTRSGRLVVVGVPGVQAARTRSCVRRRQARSSGQEADGGREAGGGRRRPSARRWRDPRLPPTPRWLSSRLLLRPASSGTFKNPSARHRPRPALAPRPAGCEPLSGRRKPGARPVAARASEELWWRRGFSSGRVLVWACSTRKGGAKCQGLRAGGVVRTWWAGPARGGTRGSRLARAAAGRAR